MAGTFPGYTPQLTGGIIQVTSQFIGQCLVDSIRNQFPRRKTQRGDFYLEHTNQVLDSNLSLIKTDDQHTIEVMLGTVIDLRTKLERACDSRLERFLKAREFKQLSKALYIIAKSASDRGKSETLLAQIKLATGAIELNNRDPFADPPSVRLFTDLPADTLERVEVTTLQSNSTGDAAVHLTLHGQGGPSQDVVATFSPGVFANDRVDCGVQTIMVINAEQDSQGSQGTN